MPYLWGRELLLGTDAEMSAFERRAVGAPVMDSAPLSRDDNLGGVSGWMTSDMPAPNGPAYHVPQWECSRST